MYLFLDEIQNVKNYEKVVDSLFIRGNIDIYITGSNSYFSGELATNLRGRYMLVGGFPYLTQYDLDQNQIDTYLEGIYNMVLMKDIEECMIRKQEGNHDKNITNV